MDSMGQLQLLGENGEAASPDNWIIALDIENALLPDTS